MRRNWTLVALVALAVLASNVQAQDGALVGAERDRVLKTLSQAVQSTRTVRGGFVQTNPNGSRVTGYYWLQRPGKVRFDYDPPSPLTLVADGKTVAVRDRALKTTDRLSQNATPLSLILKPRIDFATDARVSQVRRLGPQIAVTARDRKGEADGEITLVFEEKTSVIREWTVRDSAGQTTRVVLVSQNSSGGVDARAFDWRELTKDKPYVPPR
jgi:outer membrane lipoprotein-sorting protein